MGRAAEETPPASFKARAADILKALKEEKFTNVGVLKFLVRVGDGPLRDNVGELNTTLANQMQIALVLANTDESFGILDDPSGFVVANAMTDANHRTPEGRKAFFGREFVLSWGSGKVKPSGFLVGAATVAKNLETLTFRLDAFDRTGQLKSILKEWTCATSAELLAELGHSYTLSTNRRKALVSGQPFTSREIQAEVIAAIQSPSTNESKAAPLSALTECPIRWIVKYNAKEVRATGDTLPEPDAGDRVTFELHNPTDETYAAVLLVNGENTLYQEHLAPIACRKWVLEPKSMAEITGFQIEDQMMAAPFHVTRPDDPIPDAVRYGPHAGTFRLVVYHGRTQKEGAKPPVDAADETTTIAMGRRGTPTTDVKPQSLKALQAALKIRQRDSSNSRGLVVKGSKVERSDTEAVMFVPTSDQPVSDISLKYHTPK
jgi:hypothetical protein